MAVPSGFVASDMAPNQTLYINNINEKVKNAALKQSLYALFTQYGAIVEIISSRAAPLRGQAWVVFEDVAAATNALRQMQGFPFYDKNLRIHFARGKSDAVARKDGTFVTRDKRKRAAAGDARPGEKKAPASSEPVFIPAPPPKASNIAPNKTLFAQNLPPELTDAHLRNLFEPYGGFKEARVISTKNVAFIEFENEATATIAMQALNNYRLSEGTFLSLSYAKK